MAKILKARGIVLSHYPLHEADEVARILTENGAMLELRAKGIRLSRRRSRLIFEPGCLVSFEYYAALSGLSYLKEGYLEKRHETLKQDYLSLLTLSLFLELSASAAFYEKAPGLFVLLEGALEQLKLWNRAIEKLLLLMSFFQIRLLKISGLLGSAENCSLCDSPLGERALWNLPEVHFGCQNCKPQANKRDASMASTIALAAKSRFGHFCENIPLSTENEIMTLVKQLSHSIEIFRGKRLPAATTFYQYMDSKAEQDQVKQAEVKQTEMKQAEAKQAEMNR